MMKQIKTSSFDEVMKDLLGRPPDPRDEEEILESVDAIIDDFWREQAQTEFAAGRLSVHPKRRRTCYLCKKKFDPQFILRVSSYVWACLSCCSAPRDGILEYDRKGIKEI